MLGKAPLAAALAVVLVANVALTWLFGRRLNADAGDGRARIDRHAGTVECPACGAANDLGYRFCRDCVERLPSTAGSMDHTGRPARRDLN